MDQIVISREYSFAAAHRIEGHPKCGRLHGHNYIVIVAVRAPHDKIVNGMVMDYADLDKIVKPLVETLDHHYLVSADNIASGDVYFKNAKEGDCIVLTEPYSTAECLCHWFVAHLYGLLPSPVVLHSVAIYETEKSFCEVVL